MLLEGRLLCIFYLRLCHVYLHGDDLQFVVPSGNLVTKLVDKQLDLVIPTLQFSPEEAEYSKFNLSKVR